MSEMTIANKKLMLAGLYLSKFDNGKEGLKALGFKTFFPLCCDRFCTYAKTPAN
jgi:hypothetical protein